ncbi:MAG: hypothetical protein WD749_06270 [Phycisphaerales bacterium]
MLILNPRTVRFGQALWQGIAAVAIDRSPTRLVEEWSDGGPHAVLADVPEQRTRIVITQEIGSDDLGPPIPGDQATLSLCASPTASDAARRRLTTTAVVLRVEHEVSLKAGAIRTITLAAISEDGATDPITVTDASEGSL